MKQSEKNQNPEQGGDEDNVRFKIGLQSRSLYEKLTHSWMVPAVKFAGVRKLKEDMFQPDDSITSTETIH